MKTKHPPALSAVSIRQQRYRQRMEDGGFRRVTLWLHQDSEQVGYERGLGGDAFLPIPDDLDQMSYVTGWLRGAGERQVPIFCSCCANQMGHGAARGNYNLLTMLPTSICNDCVPLIEAEKKGR